MDRRDFLRSAAAFAAAAAAAGSLVERIDWKRTFFPGADLGRIGWDIETTGIDLSRSKDMTAVFFYDYVPGEGGVLADVRWVQVENPALLTVRGRKVDSSDFITIGRPRGSELVVKDRYGAPGRLWARS